ncbi:hypothetical protein ACHQM5_000685 [Ranunculus cassubicifolius]
MGLDTELDFDKYCKVVRNPKVGRISEHHSSKSEVKGGRVSQHRCPKSEVKVEKGRPSERSYRFRNLDDDFTEISFSRSRSSSCKTRAYAAARVAGKEVLKRDSLYEGSKEARKMKKIGSLDERQKIELSSSSESSLSFRIFDNSSLLDKTCPLVDKRISSLLSLSDDDNQPLEVRKSYKELSAPDLQDISFRFPSTPASDMTISSDGTFNINMDLRNRKDCTSSTIERDTRAQVEFQSNQTIGPLNDGNDLSERDTRFTLHKSSSEKLGMPYSPCRTESNNSKDSPRARFRKMFDPIMKSKSLRSSPVSRKQLGHSVSIGWESIKRNKTFRKSLLNDFSNASEKTDFGPLIDKKDHHSKVATSSPAHIHGILTFELKHGVPYFEFSFADPEDVLSAKTWRANNAFSWVYTFHSMSSSRSSHSSGWGTRERHKEPSMIGQMQVSCFLLSELRSNGGFDNSMVSEFVLYDIMHARRALAIEEPNETTKDTCKENLVVESSPCESNNSCDLANQKHQTPNAPVSDGFDGSTQYPWAPTDLHPNLEIAATVIQVPFEKSESLKEKMCQNLFENRIDSIPCSLNRANIKVVTPSGAHGLPSKKAGGSPSPLLERWRSGGSCDCGGWDMSCPLLVSDNRSDKKIKDRSHVETQKPLELFFQGAKDKVPALSITSIAEGQYSVDFHAQLSKLQAFSICVSLLHGSEASTAIEREKNTQNFHCNSLKVLLNEEARFLIEAVADKDKRSLIARA